MGGTSDKLFLSVSLSFCVSVVGMEAPVHRVQRQSPPWSLGTEQRPPIQEVIECAADRLEGHCDLTQRQKTW